MRSASLGRLLLDTGVLTQEQLDGALAAQKTDRRRLGELVVERGLVNPLELAQLLSHQMSCPWIALSHVDIPAEVIETLPRRLAIAHAVVPVHLRETETTRVLYVATDDPTDTEALAECAEAAGMAVRPMVAVFGEIRAALVRHYGADAGVPPPPPEVRGARGAERTEKIGGVGGGAPDGEVQPTSVAKPPPPAPPLPPRASAPAVPPPVPPAAARPPAGRVSHPPPGAPPVIKQPARSRKPSFRKDIEDHDVIEIVDETPREKRAPTVLALNAPDGFLTQCRAAVAKLGATLVDGSIMRAGPLVAEHRPCAIVVTDDVYAFDRSGLNRLALDHDAHLVVWSEEVDGHQLEPLLAGAIDRWGRSSYEKGAIIDERYELLRDLGQEAQSHGLFRWQIRNVRTARRSLLALALRSEESKESVESIRRQQKALARITHPGAVELRDAGTTELGDPYVVLEPLEGRTLDGLIAARTKLATGDACAIALQLAEILSAAHAAGVVHRRIVPENVLIIRDGYGHERVKLTNWGNATVGLAGSAEIRQDLAALAACTFEALLGRRAKPQEDVQGTDLPKPLAAILARSLAADAAAFESAHDLAHAFLEAEPRSLERTQLLEADPLARENPNSEPISAAKQRHFPRAAYRTPVRIEVPGIGAVDGRSEDISRGGLLLVSRGGVKGGTLVTLRFALPLDGRVVAESATVKWARPARADETSGFSAVGVEMTSPAAETIRQIDRYVALMSDAKPSKPPMSGA